MKQKNLVLMVVAVGCGLVAAFLTTQINAKPKVEMVEVLVAAKDLPVGTTLTQAEIDKGGVVESKPMAKDVLPPQFATTKEELVGKRLSRAVLKGETFSPAALVKGPVVTLPPGKDLVSLAMSAREGAAGFVGPGSKVDVLAGLRLGQTLKTFPLLVDMHVVAVNQTLTYEAGKPHFADMNMVSLAVTQEEALLLTLAKQRGCQLELLLRHEGKITDPGYDIKAIRKMLEDDKHKVDTKITEGGRGGSDGDVSPFPIPTVTPKEMVKVWVAKENITANTPLTNDLIKEKFTEAQWPKEFVEGACTDLTPYHTKALVHGIAKGQYLTGWMVGDQGFKPAPQDTNIVGVPKPGLNDPVKPATGLTATPPPAVEYRDVAVHVASATVIHRFMRVNGGDWKKIAELTPEQAARPMSLRQPSESDKPAKPPTDAQKID